jgi:hypothetical protein
VVPLNHKDLIMGKYNSYMNHQFGSCRLLATAHDEHRDRPVRLYMLPGIFDIVGITDGTDSWLAPVIADPLSVGVARLLEDIREGKSPAVVNKGRIPSMIGPANPGRRRVQLLGSEEAPAAAAEPRRRLLLTQPAPIPATNGRRRLNVV